MLLARSSMPLGSVRRLGTVCVAVGVAALLAAGCGASGTALKVAPDTPLKSLNVGVLVHPEKGATPDTDENVQFANYLESLGDGNPFGSVEIVADPKSSAAEVFISLNMDCNYVTQVSRPAHPWKILTLYLYAIFGLPTYVSSANYHISAVLYDKQGNIINAFFVNEPVTFVWDNQYWTPEPHNPRNWRLPFNRLLNMMDRDLRHKLAGKKILGEFGPTRGNRLSGPAGPDPAASTPE